MFSQAPVILSTGGGGHAWQGGHAWGVRDRGMCGGGRAWQERRPLQRTVRILLECILVVKQKQMETVSCDGDNILGNPLSLTCQDDTYHPHPKPVNPIEVGNSHSISQLRHANGFHS